MTYRKEIKSEKEMGGEGEKTFSHYISQQRDNVKKSKLTVDFDAGFCSCHILNYAANKYLMYLI